MNEFIFWLCTYTLLVYVYFSIAMITVKVIHAVWPGKDKIDLSSKNDKLRLYVGKDDTSVDVFVFPTIAIVNLQNKLFQDLRRKGFVVAAKFSNICIKFYVDLT